jgi:hypothetical protein
MAHDLLHRRKPKGAEQSSLELVLWNTALCMFAILNVAAWLTVKGRLERRADSLPGKVLATRKAMLALSAVYLAGCAFRSAFPMLDVQRICLFDTVLSRVAIGRGVATIAELAFIAQWALLLGEAGVEGRPFVRQAAFALLPLGVAAEAASWLGVMTRDNLLHALENSLWTLGAALVLVALVALLDGADERRRRAIGLGITAVGVYLAFMVVVDVPMYLQRWQASGETALPLAVGLGEVLRRCVPTTAIAAWREDMPWLTLYFSAGVWLSIALVEAPPLAARRASRAWGPRVQALASSSDRIVYGSARASRHRALRRS